MQIGNKVRVVRPGFDINSNTPNSEDNVGLGDTGTIVSFFSELVFVSWDHKPRCQYTRDGYMGWGVPAATIELIEKKDLQILICEKVKLMQNRWARHRLIYQI